MVDGMWKKALKIIAIILVVIILILGGLWGIFYKKAFVIAAVIDEDLEQVDYWVDEKGVNPNFYVYGKPTSLDLAILLKRPDIVNVLLENGADVDLMFKGRATPLGTVLRLNDCDMAQLLVKYKASLKEDISDDELEKKLKDCYK